jgi:hypothetical protein
VGDFNRDGNSDLAVANYVPDGSISILLGNGDGTFRIAVNYAAGPNPLSVAAGEFSGDGRLDLAVANDGGVSVLLGRGDGTFQAAGNYSAGTYPESVGVRDFNADGKPDLAVADADDPGSVSVLLGQGDGTFQPAIANRAGPYPVSLAVSDANADGKPDVVVAGDGGVSVLLCQGQGAFESAVDFPTGPNSIAVETGDFNNDGQPDLAVANYNTEGTVSVLLNTCVTAGVDLAIARGSTTATISWPFSAEGFVLESTTNLSLPDWQPVAEASSTSNGRWEVSVPINTQQRYFRLHKPSPNDAP